MCDADTVVCFPVTVSAPAPEPKPKRAVLGKWMGTDVNSKHCHCQRGWACAFLHGGVTSVLLTSVLSDSLTSKWPLTSPAVQIEEPVFALNLDPIQELSEEDKGKRSRQKQLEPLDCMLPAWMHQSGLDSSFFTCLWDRPRSSSRWQSSYDKEALCKASSCLLCQLHPSVLLPCLWQIKYVDLLLSRLPPWQSHPSSWLNLWHGACCEDCNNACLFFFISCAAPPPDPQHKTERDFPFTDSSSISERRPVEKKPEPVPEKKQRMTTSAVKTNPNMKREIRQELEQAVTQKLEALGVKPVCFYTLLNRGHEV